MNTSYYKYCIVPHCKSTVIKTPEKLFIYVPNDKKIRKQWLKLARKDNADSLSTDSRMYFCEDHFDLPNDMVNYMEYHIMGTVSQVRMKPGCTPSKFECQEDRRKRTCTFTDRPSILKKQRMEIVEECLIQSQRSYASSSSVPTPSTSDTNLQTVENIQEILCELTAEKSVQVFITNKFRSKGVQATMKFKDAASSPFKPSLVSQYTSPFKVKTILKSRPSTSGLSKIKRNILFEEGLSDSETSSYTPSIASNSASPSVHSLQIKSSSDCSELIEEDRKIQATETILYLIKKIEKKPQLYIGVPRNCYYLINLIMDEIKIPKHHLLFCLNKIRQDDQFQRLADDYGTTISNLSKIFAKNIPLIASVLRPFIVTLDRESIKKTLPIAFRHKYSNVSCIIDCLEIEIQKPSKAVNQSLTWSDYKKANTIKYLISCTPNGLVNYISPGCGGRTTDTCMVESCDFVKTLKSGMCVMADRGFKHVEQYLLKSGVKLVRPPSVTTGFKMSKSEARLTKQIASLRIHIERVIRRLREFRMLKPHACVNFNFVKILDDIIIIVCALVNLQNSLIK